MAYIFNPDHLQEIVKRRLGAPSDEVLSLILSDLEDAYRKHVETKQDWFFNIVGGATGIMTVVHSSLSEYLILFGTATGTEGFSGRYWLDIYDVVVSGEMWSYTEQQAAKRRVYRPGDLALLPRRQVKGFRLSEDCWLLEYGRGPVPTCLPMAISGALVSMDAKTIWKTVRVYGRLVIKELWQGKI